MNLKLAHIALLVRNYDDAIDFFVKKLDFVLLEDTPQTETKRWVLVAPNHQSNISILLAKAVGDQQLSSVGNQTGGRVFLFLNTDNFEYQYNKMLENGIEFIEKPRNEIYGKVVVFKDLYGNLWDLIEPK